MMDMDNYIETQSRILTSETMALQTIRTIERWDYQSVREFGGSGTSDAIVSGTWKTRNCRRKSAAFLGSLAVKRIPNTRLLEVSFESTDPDLAAKVLECSFE